MRIGIDARFYGPIGKGLGRYTEKLIENLEKIDHENDYYVFLRQENFNEYRPKNKNFKKILADYQWYTVSEQIGFPRLLHRYKLDLMHFPHFNVPLLYRRKFVVTVHDLILFHFPTVKNSALHPLWYKIKYLAYKLVIKSAVYRSSRVIAVSRFSKKDILNNFQKIPQEKILVTYEACDDYCMLSPNKDKEILSRYGIIKPYLMYVGNAYPHKNLDSLVLAFRKIHEKYPKLHLVLVGREDYFYRKIKTIVKEKKIKNIVFPDYVPDYDLDVFFHNAAAYVFPSLYEGFGLPPLEAMAKGTPVVCSDHSCMKEILGDSAHYFNGRDIKDIAQKIRDVLEQKHLQEELIKKGYQRTAIYSWKKMAQKTLALYENILH